MNRLLACRAAIKSIGAICAIVVSSWIKQSIEPTTTIVTIVAMLSVAVTVYVLVSRGIMVFVDRSRTLRRFIAGVEDVEGVWWDVVYAEGSNNAVGYGLIHIDVVDGKVVVSGRNFDPRMPNGKMTNHFRSLFVHVEPFELTYLHDRVVGMDREKKGSIMQMLGWSRIRFFRAQGRPTHYSGFYQDASGKLFEFFGERLDRREVSDVSSGLSGMLAVVRKKISQWNQENWRSV